MEIIARTWYGTSTAAKAGAYYRHFVAEVAPRLQDIPGHRGAYLLRRDAGEEVEFLAVTLWDSIESVKNFAGPNPEVAIVEPEAQAALVSFDNFVRHYEVAYSKIEGS